MMPVQAFAIVVGVFVFADFISKKTKAVLPMMLIASLVFLTAFATDIFPADLISNSGFQGLANAIMGLIIIHLGTMMSLDTLKSQWRTFAIGVSVVALGSFAIMFLGQMVFDTNVGIAGAAAALGGTFSVLMVQDFAARIVEEGGNAGLLTPAALGVLPLLILSLKNMVGFLLSGSIIKKEAQRVVGEYRKGNIKLATGDNKAEVKEEKLIIPAFLQTPYGVLLISAVAVIISHEISALTGGHVNAFVIALLVGIALRQFRILKPNALSSTDSFGILMLSLMVVAFGPLANLSPAEMLDLAGPIAFFIGSALVIIAVVSLIVGKRVGYSPALSIAVGISSFFGFPGTMIVTKEAAGIVGQNEEEVAVIEQEVLPIMITAGFATITITSVLIGGIIVGFMVM